MGPPPRAIGPRPLLAGPPLCMPPKPGPLPHPPANTGADVKATKPTITAELEFWSACVLPRVLVVFLGIRKGFRDTSVTQVLTDPVGFVNKK
jgi:hypothetical protein